MALSFNVYSGGAVLVEYGANVDQTYQSINITLFGDVIENLLVVDGLDLPLDHSFLNGSLSIYSLGAEEVVITYLTQDLTEKVGRYWAVSLNASMDSLITLPIDGHIVSLNKVPDVIESFGGQIQLVMSEGLIEVTYVIGVVGTKEYTQSARATGQVARIDFVSSLPDVRRRGIGTAISLTPLRVAEAKGHKVAVLWALPMGVPIFRRIGFTDYCEINIYRYPYKK